MSPVRKRWARRLGFLVSALGLMLGALVMTLRPTGYLDFYRHRDRYEQIVQAIKATEPASAEHEYSVSYGDIEAAVWRDDAGHHTIALTVFDLGHMGTLGYLYSDTPPVLDASDSYSNVQAPGGPWMLGKQVASHWWVIENNLG